MRTDNYTEVFATPLEYRTDRWGRFLYRLSLAREALRGRCRDEQDWAHGFHLPYWLPFDQDDYDRYVFTRLWRWAHTAKAVICVLFFRHGAFNRHGAFKYNDYGIEVAWWDAETHYSDVGEVGSWTVLMVAKGWRDWRWSSYRDGT